MHKGVISSTTGWESGLMLHQCTYLSWRLSAHGGGTQMGNIEWHQRKLHWILLPAHKNPPLSAMPFRVHYLNIQLSRKDRVPPGGLSWTTLKGHMAIGTGTTLWGEGLSLLSFWAIAKPDSLFPSRSDVLTGRTSDNWLPILWVCTLFPQLSITSFNPEQN